MKLANRDRQDCPFGKDDFNAECSCISGTFLISYLSVYTSLRAGFGGINSGW